MSNLYKTIENLCSEKGVTITQMCLEAEVSRGGLSDLKAGRSKNLSASSLSKISNYFDVTTDYLIGRSENKEDDQLKKDLEEIENLLRSKPEAEQKVLIKMMLKVLR